MASRRPVRTIPGHRTDTFTGAPRASSSSRNDSDKLMTAYLRREMVGSIRCSQHRGAGRRVDDVAGGLTSPALLQIT
jgi:hypothetical protein